MQESYLEQLNPSQKEAVTTTEGALLILAVLGVAKQKLLQLASLSYR